MTARRKIPAALAERLARVCVNVDSFAAKLAEEFAPLLATARDRKEAEALLDQFVQRLITRLDAEEADLVDELRTTPKTTVH